MPALTQVKQNGVVIGSGHETAAAVADALTRTNDLSGMDFHGAVLPYMVFEDVDFRGSEFAYADLTHTEFVGCKFDSDTNFRQARMHGVVFRDCTLKYACVDACVDISTITFPGTIVGWPNFGCTRLLLDDWLKSDGRAARSVHQAIEAGTWGVYTVSAPDPRINQFLRLAFTDPLVAKMLLHTAIDSERKRTETWVLGELAKRPEPPHALEHRSILNGYSDDNVRVAIAKLMDTGYVFMNSDMRLQVR